MQTLVVTPEMRAFIGGTFYPKNFSLIMFPTEEEALSIAKQLSETRFRAEDIFMIPPRLALQEIASTADSSQLPLPSVGSDGTMARAIADLAHKGHWGILVHTGNEGDIDALKESILDTRCSFAKAYHSFAIEDLN